MTKAQMMAMSDAEVRLRLENVRLKIKITMTTIRDLDEKLVGFSGLIRKKNLLRRQEKKWREEIDRRETAKKIERIQEAIDELNERSGG